MASFLSCPTEVIHAILERVSFRDLLAVSLTSRKSNQVTAPILYSRVDFHVFRDNPRQLIHLCRSIFSKPELATYIKFVRLRDGEQKIQDLYRSAWYFSMTVPKAAPPRPTDDDGIPKFVSFVTKTGLAYADSWNIKLREGDLNAYVALLLSQLPNLRCFRVGYAVVLPYIETQQRRTMKRPETTVGENQFLGKIFQSGVFDRSEHGISRFEHLEEISFPGPMETDPGRNPDFCNPQDMVALLNLPSIHSITGWSLNPNPLPLTWPLGPPNPDHLTSLSLSFIHVDFLAQILQRTRALKCLSWEWKYIKDVDPRITEIIDLDKLVEALQPIRNTLEDLSISATNTYAWDNELDMPEICVHGSLNGLESFNNVKQFKAPFALLLPDWEGIGMKTRRLEDSIPRNVEVVTVTDATEPADYSYSGEDEMAMLRSWIAETASTRTPNLVAVCYYLKYGSDRFEYEQYSEFEEVFKGTQIRYRILKQEDEQPWEVV